MKIIFDSYRGDEQIPLAKYLKNKKLAKYFNREGAAAAVCAAKLLEAHPIPEDTPFYYETGSMEYEDYGLDNIVTASMNEGVFSTQFFIEKGTKAVTPLTQFKSLYNMPLSLIAIEHGLKGDNAVIYSSAQGLLMQAMCAPEQKHILLGCGKIRQDAMVETSFALISKIDIPSHFLLLQDCEAIEIFRIWHETKRRRDTQ